MKEFNEFPITLNNNKFSNIKFWEVNFVKHIKKTSQIIYKQCFLGA